VYVVVPCAGVDTVVMSRSSPSISTSLSITSIRLSVESSSTVTTSSFAVGGSLTPVTVTYIVALSEPPLLSVIVYVN
jgi:hypothetical protein